MDVAVYYDSCFAKKFGGKAKTRIRALMAIVDEMYSEKDTLKDSSGLTGFYTMNRIHCISDIWSSVIRSNRLYGQFSVGPIYEWMLRKIYCINGLIGYVVNF